MFHSISHRYKRADRKKKGSNRSEKDFFVGRVSCFPFLPAAARWSQRVGVRGAWRVVVVVVVAVVVTRSDPLVRLRSTVSLPPLSNTRGVGVGKKGTALR